MSKRHANLERLRKTHCEKHPDAIIIRWKTCQRSKTDRRIRKTQAVCVECRREHAKRYNDKRAALRKAPGTQLLLPYMKAA